MADSLVHIESLGYHFGNLLYFLTNQGCHLGTFGVTGEPKKCPDDAMYSKPHVLLCFFDMLKGNMHVHMDAHVVQLTIIEPSHRKHARPYGHACCPYDTRAPDENAH